MPTFVLLKDGREMVVWSDNVDEKTYNVYDPEYLHDFDPEYLSTELVAYDDVIVTSTSRLTNFTSKGNHHGTQDQVRSESGRDSEGNQ